MSKLYLGFLALLLLTYCGDSNPVPPSITGIDKDKALASTITENLVYNGVQSLAQASSNLASQATKACGDGDQPLESLQASWTIAMTSYHYLEAVAYGPLSENQGDLCDQGGVLACQIYSWPLSTEKSIRKNMKHANKKPDSFALDPEKVGARGLDALEYILFFTLKGEPKVSSSSGTVCPYLSIVANDLETSTTELLDRYENNHLAGFQKKSTENDFRQELAQVIQAFSFFEKKVLYRKINLPIGLPSESGGKVATTCSVGVDCHEQLEHPWSLGAKPALEANLDAFIQIFEGGPNGQGFGIYDYLVEVGEKDQGDFIKTLLGDLQTEQGALPAGEPFVAAVKAFDPGQCESASLCSTQKKWEALSDWIKGDLLTLLSKETASGVTGDND